MNLGLLVAILHILYVVMFRLNAISKKFTNFSLDFMSILNANFLKFSIFFKDISYSL